MYADLHVHSTYSDGTNTPEELFALAQAAGLSCIAISDHDSVEGVKAEAGADHLGVRLIPAIEVSTIFRRRFLHVLGYWIDVNSMELARYIAEASADKTQNTRVNFATALADGAISYEWERVALLNPGQVRLSGVHVVNAMKQDGAECRGMTHREMFWKYFRPEGDRFSETEKATPQDAINVILAAGGVPVIAHPKLAADDSVVLDMIRCGAQGIEAHYPLHTAEETRKYLAMAEKHSLYVTGGSDWHGANSAPEVKSIGMTGLENDSYGILRRRNPPCRCDDIPPS